MWISQRKGKIYKQRWEYNAFQFSKCIVSKESILDGDKGEEKNESLEVFARIFYILIIPNSLPVTSLPPRGLELNKRLILQHSHNSYQVGLHKNILSPLIFTQLGSK